MRYLKQIRERYPNANVNRNFIFAPAHDLLYVKNQKAGCSTFTLMLCRLHAGDPELTEQQLHRNAITPRVRDLERRYVNRLIGGEGLVFSFVRDPVARAVSCYRDKMLRQHGRFAPKVNRVLGRDSDLLASVSLDDFIAVLEASDPAEMDPHWRPQHLNLMHDLIPYGFIGRMEDMAADIDRLWKRAGLPDVGRVHAGGNPSASRVELTAAQRGRLEQVYRRDFELFGY